MKLLYIPFGDIKTEEDNFDLTMKASTWKYSYENIKGKYDIKIVTTYRSTK